MELRALGGDRELVDITREHSSRGEEDGIEPK